MSSQNVSDCYLRPPVSVSSPTKRQLTRFLGKRQHCQEYATKFLFYDLTVILLSNTLDRNIFLPWGSRPIFQSCSSQVITLIDLLNLGLNSRTFCSGFDCFCDANLHGIYLVNLWQCFSMCFCKAKLSCNELKIKKKSKLTSCSIGSVAIKLNVRNQTKLP